MHNQYRYAVIQYLLVCLVLLPVSAKPVAQVEMTDKRSPVNGMKVWGVAYERLVVYPERGLDAKTLVNTLVEARNQYPMTMSLEQINGLADEVTQLYRRRGYKFHRVIVPPQKPKLGLVEFSIIEARLGDIQVRGADVNEEAIKNLFSRLIQKPLYQPDIDRTVQVLKAQNGIDAVAYYSRGRRSGEVRLNIKVKQKKLSIHSQLDNHGSESTGVNRMLVGGSWHNPTGRFDQLSAGVMTADSGENNYYGYINYVAPLWNLNNSVSMSLSNNQFSIGEEFSALDFSGDARIGEIEYRHKFKDSFKSRQAVSLSGAYKDADYDSLLNDSSIERDEISKSFALAWHGYNQLSPEGWANQFSLQLVNGRYRVDGLFEEPREFNKLSVTDKMQFGWGELGSRWSSVVTTEVRGQYAEDIVPSFEKLVLTGANGVRAFQPGFFAAERGAIASVEWHFPWLFSSSSDANFSVAPMLFYDAGYGEKLLLSDQVFDRAFMSGAGLGLEISLDDYWLLHIVAAKDFQSSLDSGLEVETADVFIRLNYRH